MHRAARARSLPPFVRDSVGDSPTCGECKRRKLDDDRGNQLKQLGKEITQILDGKCLKDQLEILSEGLEGANALKLPSEPLLNVRIVSPVVAVTTECCIDFTDCTYVDFKTNNLSAHAIERFGFVKPSINDNLCADKDLFTEILNEFKRNRIMPGLINNVELKINEGLHREAAYMFMDFVHGIKECSGFMVFLEEKGILLKEKQE